MFGSFVDLNHAATGGHAMLQASVMSVGIF